jgi:predicted TIM-barrel fold metal-dependent hydrolase
MRNDTAMETVDSATRATGPKISDIGLVSADSHVNEPRDLWSENLPPSLRSQAMEGIESGEDGSWKVVFNGTHVFKRDMASEAERLAVLDPDKRFEILRSEGIVAETIFPTIGLYVWMLEDPMWDAIDAAGLPVVMHQGTGFDTIWYRGPGATVANLVSTETIGPRVATLLATSGVLERHPNLHVVFVEFNTGWLAWVEELMDYYDKVFREYDYVHRERRPNPTVYPDLAHPPSWYVKRQCHATFQVDNIGMRNVPESGHASLMWGHDYPHEEGTFPNSRRLVDEQAAHVSPEDARRIFRENAIDVFNFDRALLDQPF